MADRKPRLPRWQRAIGYATIGTIAGIAYLIGKPSGPYTPRIEEPSIEQPVLDDRREFETCADEGMVAELLEDIDVTPIRQQAYRAIIDHETGCDPLAISQTGAAGLVQFTVQTAYGRGLAPLHRPTEFFDTTGTAPRFREPRDSIANVYAQDLRRVVEAADDPARLDARFDPRRNIEAFHEEFSSNLSRVQEYVTDESTSVRLTMLAHNAGITRVLGYLEEGARTPQQVLQRVQDSEDEEVSVFRKAEIQRFYTSVNAYFEAYGGPRAEGQPPEPSFLLLPERNSRREAVFRTVVVPRDSRYGIARSFNAWDARRGDMYEDITYEDVVDEDGVDPGTIRPGEHLYVTASPKVRED